jgi:hypothetical protein
VNEEDVVGIAKEDEVTEHEGPSSKDEESKGTTIAIDDTAEHGGCTDGDEVGDGEEGGSDSRREVLAGILHDLGGDLIEGDDTLVEEEADEEENPDGKLEGEDIGELGRVLDNLVLVVITLLGLLNVGRTGVIKSDKEKAHDKRVSANTSTEPDREGNTIISESRGHGEVDRGTNTSEGKHETKDKSEILAGEPADDKGVLSNGKGFTTKTEDEATEDTETVGLGLNTETEDNLSKPNKTHEENSTLADTSDTINNEATEESKDNVGPGVDGIKKSVVGIGIVTEPALKLTLNGSRSIEDPV